MINLDADTRNADWTKTTWDLHNVNSAEDLVEYLASIDMDLEHFKTLPVYLNNVDKIEWLKSIHKLEKLMKAGPPPPGLVPQSGDPEHPIRWIRPKEDAAPKQETAPAEKPSAMKPDISLPKSNPVSIKEEAVIGFTDKRLRKGIFKDKSPEEIRQFVEDAWGVGVSGFHTTITKAEVVEGDVEFRMTIIDSEGFNSGTLIRQVRGTNVHHNVFAIDLEYQGSGIAADIIERSEQTYIVNGIKSITLDANASIGGYAWARQGYDFASLRSRKFLQSNLEERIDELVETGRIPSNQGASLKAEVANMKHSWEIAGWNPLNDDPGKHLGKELMLGQDYRAKKTLDESDPGYRVGVAYRLARAKTLSKVKRGKK